MVACVAVVSDSIIGRVVAVIVASLAALIVT